MPHPRNRYLLFAAGFAGAVVFLWFKMALYDKLEYQTDLFSILQLSRDFLWGKPLLYENAYGDNTAYHNSFLMPLYAPFTVAFGGKGLFVAGFGGMLWACFLIGGLFKNKPLYTGLGFLVLFFSPVAFYLWDDYRFGWHPETIYYPLCTVFLASLALKNKSSLWLSGLCILLSREDGILLLWALYLAYSAAAGPKPFWETVKKMLPATLATLTLFLLGMAWLSLRAGGESRVALAADRFLQHYSAGALGHYFRENGGHWLLLCLPVWVLAQVRMRRWAFAGWSALGLALLLATHAYAGIYYFPDGRYGITWAPRLAGTYGYLVGLVFLALLYGKPFSTKPVGEWAFLAIALVLGYQQYDALKRLPAYYQYSVLDRVHLALFRPSPLQPDAATQTQLETLAKRLPAHYPLRLEEPLFALFEQADCIWPQTGQHPWRAPKMVITKQGLYVDREPLPTGFEKLRQIGEYEIWALPGPTEMEYVWGD